MFYVARLVAEAKRLFDNARKRKWFRPVIDRLARMAGPAERCMFCSGSESSDVEHYWPKAVFPEKAMSWNNYLWSCAPCNRCKGVQFTLAVAGAPVLIDPVTENVWDFFYIDRFGNLTPKFDTSINDFNYRAQQSLRILGLDGRQAVQEARRLRMDELIQMTQDSLARMKAGEITPTQVRSRVRRWQKGPAQPDVADFFLNGPGRIERPFKDLFDALAV